MELCVERAKVACCQEERASSMQAAIDDKAVTYYIG